MCNKCKDFDDKIAHYQRIASHITDQLTLDGIAAMITEARAKKSEFRCDEAQKK
jgi:hypothetical protein